MRDEEKSRIYTLFYKDFTVYIDSTSGKSCMQLKQKRVNKWHLENAASAEAALVDHVKCIRQFVQIVEKNARFHSSLLKEDRFTAGSVTQNIENTEMD